MTFSIAARCARTGRFAVAVASSSPAVASRCAFARAGIGGVTTQNITDPRLGPRALDLMAAGANAQEVCAIIERSAPHAEYRQFTVIDREGRTAGFSGSHVLGVHASAQGVDVVSAGNLLANPDVPHAIVGAFEAGGGCRGRTGRPRGRGDGSRSAGGRGGGSDPLMRARDGGCGALASGGSARRLA